MGSRWTWLLGHLDGSALRKDIAGGNLEALIHRAPCMEADRTASAGKKRVVLGGAHGKTSGVLAVFHASFWIAVLHLQ